MADFEAFVLTGGQSERMGRDKALLEIDGVPMAVAVAAALRDAGATRVRCVGGDRAALGALGLDVLDDEHPAAGPLGGVLVAVRVSDTSVTLVAPCDLVRPRPDDFATLVSALERAPRAQVGVPVIDDHWRPLPCALRSGSLEQLESAFVAGERAMRRAFARLERVEIDAGPFADADSPGDLPGRR